MDSTSDEQQGSMGPDGLYKPGRLTVDVPPDTHGHAIKGRPAKDDEQAGSETGTEASDDDDTEGHRPSMYSDRELKRDITPVSW